MTGMNDSTGNQFIKTKEKDLCRKVQCRWQGGTVVSPVPFFNQRKITKCSYLKT